MMSEEGSVALKDQEECVSKTNEVPKPPPSVSLRRHSTGAIGTPGGKLEVQSRYRGNHHVPSTHDLCKHGKGCEPVDVVKPWKVVRRRSVEGSVAVKAEVSGLRRTSSLPDAKPESSAAAKRDALAVKKKTCVSVNLETSRDSEMERSFDGSRVRSNGKALDNKGGETTLTGGSAVVRKVPGYGNETSSSAMKNVSRISDAESSKVKNKEKAKIQTTSGEDVKEKTVCVVEASVKGVESEKQASSEKKTMRSRLISLATPKRGSSHHSPAKQVPGKVTTSKKKESGDPELVAKKIRSKRTGVKVTLAKQVSSKKGKTLEPRLEDTSPKQLETETKGRKKNLKGIETKSDSCQGSKREKVVLRRRNQGKKKMMTLFNNVIEETVNKLIKVRKTKVKALIGAFETVISLQNTKTPQRGQSNASTSASKVNPSDSKQ